MSDGANRDGWFAEFRRRRMIRAMAAYLVGAWLLLQIANVTFPPLGLPDGWQRALIIALVIGIVPAFVVSWFFDVSPRGIVRTPAVDAQRTAASVQAASGGVGASVRAGADAASQASIAVLPFSDLSPNKDQDWFCDGLAEEIIDALTCVRQLRVASRTASFRFRDGSVDPREIGAQLRVGAILEGSECGQLLDLQVRSGRARRVRAGLLRFGAPRNGRRWRSDGRSRRAAR